VRRNVRIEYTEPDSGLDLPRFALPGTAEGAEVKIRDKLFTYKTQQIPSETVLDNVNNAQILSELRSGYALCATSVHSIPEK